MIIDVEFHEFCLMFPNADKEDFDGRTRYLACKVTNTQPTFMPFTGDRDEAYSYVVSKNLHRRHLTNVQRERLPVVGVSHGTAIRRSPLFYNALPWNPI